MHLLIQQLLISLVVAVVWKGIHSRSDTNRTLAEGLFFYYQAAVLPRSDLEVISLSQHQAPSSKTVRAACSVCCLMYGPAIRTWSAVCSEAPHSQFNEGSRPHLYVDEWNGQTLVHRRLSLTQADRKSSSQQAWHWFWI